MDCVILAAGYGTRLQKELDDQHEALRDYPKALLPVGNTCLLDILLAWLPSDIGKIVLVTNDLYYQKFYTHLGGRDVFIINDGTRRPEDRLGAVGDLVLALEHVRDDFVLLASDLRFYAAFDELLSAFKKKRGSIHLCYIETGERILQKGVLELDVNNKIVGFEEKPKKPKTDIAATPVYFIQKQAIPHIIEYRKRHPDRIDRPGDMISHLIQKTPWFAHLADKPPLDIVGLQSYTDMAGRLSHGSPT